MTKGTSDRYPTQRCPVSSDGDEIFKRVFQSVISFYASAIDDIFGKEKESEKSLKLRDIEVNKWCLFLQRAINKSSYADALQGRALFRYSFELERISDVFFMCGAIIFSLR